MLGVQSVGIQQVGKDTTESNNLLCNGLAHSTSGLWFQILPIDGHEDDIWCRVALFTSPTNKVRFATLQSGFTSQGCSL